MAEPTKTPDAGLDLTRPFSTDDLIDPRETTARAEATFQSQFTAAQTEYSPPTAWTYVQDLAGEQLTAEAIRQFNLPSFEGDPNFDDKQRDTLMKEDQDAGLPDIYLETLARANSRPHYDALRQRARDHFDAQKRLADLGWTGVGARFLASMIDPATLAVGVGTFGLTVSAARAWRLGTAGQLAANAVGGAAGSAAVEVGLEAVGVPRTTEDMIMAIGIGGVFGAALGPIARNPATQREAAQIYQTSAKLLTMQPLKEDLARLRDQIPAPVTPEPPAPVTPATSSRLNAAETALERFRREEANTPGFVFPNNEQEMADLIARGVRDSEGYIVEYKPAPAQSLQRAVEDVTAALNGDPVDPTPAITQAIQDVISPPEAPAPAAPRPVSEAVVKMAESPMDPVPPEVRATIASIQSENAGLNTQLQQVKRQLDTAEVDARATANPRWLADFQGADGMRYRIMHQGDPSGPYTVMKGDGAKFSALQKDVPTLNGARALVPETAPRGPMLSLSRLQDFTPDVRYRKDRARDVPGDGVTLKAQNHRDGNRTYFITVPDSKTPVGFVEVKRSEAGWEVAQVEVIPDFRGRKLQQKAYDAIEKDTGEQMKPSGILSADGYKQWQRRNPELVKWHREDPSRPGWYFSPKSVIVNREMTALNLANMAPITDLPKLPPALIEAANDVANLAARRLGKRHADSTPEEWSQAVDAALRERSSTAGLSREQVKDLAINVPVLREEANKLRRVQSKEMYEQTLNDLDAWLATLPPEAKTEAALRAMHDLRAGSLLKPEMRTQVESLLDQILPKGIKRSVMDDPYRDPTGALSAGAYLDQVVYVSLRGDDPLLTANHETVHALRGIGAFAPKEWKELMRYATKINARERYQIDARYRDLYVSRFGKEADDRLNEEAIAHMAADYARGVRFGSTLDRVMERISQMFRQVRELFGGRSAVDIFEDIQSGALARRFDDAQVNRPRQMRTTPEVTPEGKLRFYHGSGQALDKLDAQASKSREWGPAVFLGADPEVARSGSSTAQRVLHTVDADVSPDMILDANARVSQQPPAIREKLMALGTGDYNAWEVLKAAALTRGVSPRDVALELGIPMLKNELRRGMPEYVALDDSRLQITQRGEPLLAEPNLTNERGDRAYIQDTAWTGIRDEDVARGQFSRFRFDWSSRFLKSDNPVVRMLGNALVNESTGLTGHRVNSRPADIEQEFLFTRWMTEYNRVRRPALEEYAKNQGWNALQRTNNQNEFYQQVGLYVANRVPGREFDPAVVRLGNHVKTLQKEILDYAKNPFKEEGGVGRPVRGADEVEPNDNYLWRKIDTQQWLAAIDQHGDRAVTDLVRGAILQAQPDIDAQLLDRLARGYVQSVTKRTVMGDSWSVALAEGNYERLMRMLQEDTNLTLEERTAFLDRLVPRNPETGNIGGADKGRMGNLKRRVFLDESAEVQTVGRDGNPITLSFRDLLDNNIENVFSQYARRMSGRVAMAKVRIRHPQNGQLLVDGITSDAELSAVTRMAQSWAYDNLGGLRASEINFKDAQDLQFIYNRIVGNADPEQFTNTAQWMRRIRQYMNMRLLGQVGIAQLGEYGNAAGTLGVRAMFGRVPGMRRMVTESGELKLRNQLFSELENLGIGVERLHGFSWSRGMDDTTGLPFETPTAGIADRIDNALRAGQRITYEASGMFPIQVMQERQVAAAILDKFAEMGRKVSQGGTLSRGDRARMAQLGISDDMMERIARQFDDHATVGEGVLFPNKVTRLNLMEWDDIEAKAVFERSVFRYTRKLIQQNDLGNMAQFMSNPFWATIFHLRGFGFTSWSNNFLYNIHMGDPAALTAFSYSVGWNAVVRALQVQAVAATRSDGDDYLEKNLTPEALGLAAFQRAGWSSIIPMGVDTTLAFAGQPGLFNARTTGQASDAIFGNTTLSFIDSAAKGIGGAVDSVISDRPISQAEVRSIAGMAPFSNLFPMVTGLSYLIQDLPERAPRKEIN
jgi:hypothetical protein